MAHNPYSVKIELARGCTRRCDFCTLSTIDWRDDAWQFIKVELFEVIVKDLATWTPKVRLELDERGEPSFHPHLLEILARARQHMPKAQINMISNGDMVQKKNPEAFVNWVQSLFAAGMNVLVFDCYEEERLQLMKKLLPTAIVYGEGGGIKKSPWTYMPPKTTRDIYLLPGYWFNKLDTRKLRNQGGNLDVVRAAEHGYTMHKSVEEMSNKMCTRPFKEFVIYSDGTLPLCCDDWRQEGVIGRFPDDVKSLRYAWYNLLNPYRVNLINKDRTAQSPCNKCNTPTGFRSAIEANWFKKNLIIVEKE